MFRTVPLSNIGSFSQQWYMSYSLRAGSGRNSSSVLILLASCRQTCMTYTIAVCTVKNSWWWTEELSETCRVLFQKWIWEIGASGWSYFKDKNPGISNILLTAFSFVRTVRQWSRMIFLGAFENCGKPLLASCRSVCLSDWNNSAPTERIFMKFDIWVVRKSLSRESKFL